MKILFLSFYYQPDLSAGSFRATALINALLDTLPSDVDIDLITTTPNRYSSFTSEAQRLETFSRLTIHRISMPTHMSGFFGQAKAFVIFAISAIHLSKRQKYSFVFATSSRLMTAALGAFIARRLKLTLYLDLRDIFVDTIKDVLSRRVFWLVRPIFSAIESWTVRASGRINLVSAGFLPYFQGRYPKKNYTCYTNGIDDEFIENKITDRDHNISSVLSVVYAGNMGDGQGLHAIIPELAKRFTGRLHFKLVGDGGRRKQLVSAVKASGCTNVEVLPPVKREELIQLYQSADVLFLHLNDYKAFKKVLPSKLFEYGAMGKPIWAGVAGYAAEFVEGNISNASIFKPCDVESAVTAFDRLELTTNKRIDFIEKFARRTIMREMALDIIALLKKT